MLEKYTLRTSEDVDRVSAVAAALEIIKASVSAPSAYEGKEKLEKDAQHTIAQVANIADAIQAAINKR